MLKIGIDARKNRSEERSELLLVINGEPIEGSWASLWRGEISGGIYDVDVLDSIISSSISEVLLDVSNLYIPYEPSWSEDIYQAQFLRNDKKGSVPLLRFEFSFDSEMWARPWSIADFAQEIIGVSSRLNIPGLTIYRFDSEFITNGFGFSCEIFDINEKVEEVLERWAPHLRLVIETALSALATRTLPNAVTAAFQFPEEITAACSQYLIYFGQFLADIGIDASVTLSDRMGHVLFSVMPKDPRDALETIRSALDTYLKIPGDSAFMAEASQSQEIAVLQLRANVSHLEGQLSIAQAVIQAKDATIQALHLSNFHLQQITLLPRVDTAIGEHQQTGTSGNKKDTEQLIEGLISVRESDLKGFVVHWPEFIRRLKRRFRRGEG